MNTSIKLNQVSTYKNFQIEEFTQILSDLLLDIKNETHKSEINSIRLALHKEDFKKADEIKRGLLAFTTSGTFGNSRTKTDMISYSQIIGLDFDYIPIEELDHLKLIISQCAYTYAAFVSPSGQGIKVFIKVNSEAKEHKLAYNQVAKFYKNLTSYDFDPKCKDINRLCFVSSDSDLYLNESSVTFNIKITETKPSTPKQNEKFQYRSIDDAFDQCLEYTEQKEDYQPGNRNNFIYLFANNANRLGIDEQHTFDYCITNFDKEEEEIKKTVNSAYKHHIAEFATFARIADLQKNTESQDMSLDSIDTDNPEDFLKNTPRIPDEVYKTLPPILLESCQVFKEPREKDVFLTGALAILSGCLPNVSGVYHGSTVYPSLFSFILAPAASGKGVLKYAKVLADAYHDKTLAESKEEKMGYLKSMEAYKTSKNKENLEIPVPPKFKVVHIPANTSNAKIIEHLDFNDGRGIICETEADTLGQTFKNEWGSYSDMLRKSFHHEKISVSRKTEGEFVEVNCPQLSVALSGTLKQVFNIISSAEDGLFSRFIFYVFKTDAFWMDPSPKGNPINLNDYFKKQSKEVLKMVEFYETDKMTLEFSDEQWRIFNNNFFVLLDEVNTFLSEDALSIVKRLGLILYRLCMIFTAIRKYTNNDPNQEISCLDIDFENAISLTTVYLEHSKIMFNNLPKQESENIFKKADNKKMFFDALPDDFTRKEAIALSKNYNLKERSVDYLLKDCLVTHLTKTSTGSYSKVKKRTPEK